jgi:dihydrofolate reductase
MPLIERTSTINQTKLFQRWFGPFQFTFVDTCSREEDYPVKGERMHARRVNTHNESKMHPDLGSRVTIHMAASLDGFIARKDGRVDWLETSDEFVDGEDAMDSESIDAFLDTIDCYVMGSRTYETALRFDAQGLGWPYGDKPTFVLTTRDLPRIRSTVEFYSGDLGQFVNGRLRPTYDTIWFVGGGVLSAECLRLGLADELRYSILPILIGDGIRFFEKLGKDVPLHLVEVKAYKTGMVELRYDVRQRESAEALNRLSMKS